MPLQRPAPKGVSYFTMSGQIHRFKKERDFVQLDTHALRNPELSFKAKGLHSYLLQLPENWQVNIADLSKRSTDGRDSVSTGIAELIEAGYIIRERAFDENGLFAGYDYNVFEQPEHAETWKSVNGKSVNGKSVNGKSVTNNNEEEQELFETKIKGVNAGASAPLSPPFKKVNEIQPLEAEKENPTPPVPARPPAPTIVKLYDNQLPGVTIADSIPPQPMTKPETTGREQQKREQKEKEISLATRVISYLNEKAGRSFRVNADANAKGIIARAREGFTEDEMRTVIDFKTAEWGKDTKFYQYLTPETLFRPSNFENYLQAARAAKPKSQQQNTRSQINHFGGESQRYDEKQAF